MLHSQSLADTPHHVWKLNDWVDNVVAASSQLVDAEVGLAFAHGLCGHVKRLSSVATTSSDFAAHHLDCWFSDDLGSNACLNDRDQILLLVRLKDQGVRNPAQALKALGISIINCIRNANHNEGTF